MKTEKEELIQEVIELRLKLLRKSDKAFVLGMFSGITIAIIIIAILYFWAGI